MLVHGADLFVKDSGGAGEPVVFLHGFLFDGRQYAAQVEALREDYRCITIDFRGQGRSGPARGGFQIEQQAADVLEVLRQLEVDCVHLVGLSMGGFVAMRLAARTPERIRSAARPGWMLTVEPPAPCMVATAVRPGTSA